MKMWYMAIRRLSHVEQLLTNGAKSVSMLVQGRVTHSLLNWEMPKHQVGHTLVTAPFIAHSDGYCPPELLHGKISPMSDVFSYRIHLMHPFTHALTRVLSLPDTYSEDCVRFYDTN